MKMIDKIADAIKSAGGEISSRDLMSAMGGHNDRGLRREIQMAVQSGFDRGTVELTSDMKLRIGANLLKSSEGDEYFKYDAAARIIDPGAFAKYDEAYARRDGYDQLSYINRLNAAREKAKAIAELQGVSIDPPIAWESTTPCYIKFITDERYRSFSPEAQRWYKPYRCSSCSGKETAHDNG